MKNLKVALVCDWLTEVGGAEEVLLEFHKMFPDAPIYTSIYRKGKIDWFKNTEIKTGWLNFLPVWSRRFVAPLRQNFFKNLDLSGYDLVISVTGCDAKFIKTDGFHLCFCHIPTQYYWGKREEYLKNPGFGALNPLVRKIYQKLLPKLAEKDFLAAKNPDEFLTVSNFAKQEIKTYYKREAKVISPPVNTTLFAQAVDNYKTKRGKSQAKITTYNTIKSNKNQVQKSEQKFYTKLKTVENLSILTQIIAKYPDGFYLNFSRQVNWKRLDLVVEAFKNLRLPLVLVGNGPETKRLKKLARGANNITFVDFLPKKDLALLSSLAKAFIFPSKEPFGIAPVEALAAGCPVIAFEGGGALDFIKNGKNGLFFESQTAKSLEKVLLKFETGNVSLDPSKKISASVQKFSTKNFEKKLKNELRKLSLHSSVSPEVVIEGEPGKRFLCSSGLPELASEDEGPSPVKTGARNPSPKSIKIACILVLALPPLLFLSNFPLITFGDTNSMHLKLSLPLLWLLLFSVISLKPVLKYLKSNLKTPLLAFPVFLIFSVLISPDKLRAILTAGVIICLFLSVIGLTIYLKTEKLPKNFKKTIIIETVVICFFCLAQSLFDTLGTPESLTKICETCKTTIFGFPHPNGFAIEPQFMGSLLIVPLFLAYNSLLENKTRKNQGKTVFAILVIETTLFFTFSRGAIYATILALIFLIFTRKSLKKALKILLLSLNSFILSLCLQGSLAVIGPTNTSFTQAAETAISQLTLGKIAPSAEKAQSAPENDVFEEPEIFSNPVENSENSSNTPNFSGYVAESTDRRLELATFALKISLESPKNTLFGTGLGSSGLEMYNHFPERQGHAKEIVQNEYLAIFLELGLIGSIAFILSIITFLKLEKFHFEPYAAAILLAFAITLLFFSGLPNALHVYLLPVLCYNLMYDKDRLSRV